MQTAGLTCAILGTFYDRHAARRPARTSAPTSTTSTRRAGSASSSPTARACGRSSSYMADSYGDEPRRPFCIGTVRYASTRRRERLAAAVGKPADVRVEIDIADFVAHKTAVLGMTRKGKSNTNKVIATATYQYAREKELKIGQLIFDPAGEYANVTSRTGPRSRRSATTSSATASAPPTTSSPRRGAAIARAELLRRDTVSVVWSLVGDSSCGSTTPSTCRASSPPTSRGPRTRRRGTTSGRSPTRAARG